MNNWRIIALAITLVIVATVLILWLVPAVAVTHTEQEPYTTTETYTEKEPYTATETYYETQPSVTNQDIRYSIVRSWFHGWGFWDFKGSGGDLYVKIQNLDSTNGGMFNVTYNITLSGGGTANRYSSKYIGPGQILDIQATYAGAGIVSFTYSVTPPTKQVTIYQQVAKTRNVMQFRDVQKTREVVKIRDVEKTKRVPVFEYLFD